MTTTAYLIGSDSQAGPIVPDLRRGIVYAPTFNPSAVAVIRPDHKQVLAIPVRRYNEAASLDERTGRLYVANSAGVLTIVRGMHVEHRLRYGKPSRRTTMLTDPVSHLTYVADRASRAIAVVRGMHRIDMIKVGDRPRAMAIDPTTETIYVASDHNNRLAAIRNGRELGSIDLPAQPTAVAVDPTRDRVFVACRRPASVIVTKRLAQVGDLALPTNSNPQSIGVAPALDDAYVGELGTQHDDENGPEAPGYSIIHAGTQVTNLVAPGARAVPTMVVDPVTSYAFAGSFVFRGTDPPISLPFSGWVGALDGKGGFWTTGDAAHVQHIVVNGHPSTEAGEPVGWP